MSDAASLEVVLDRPLPGHRDLERAVLGTLLIKSSAWYRIPDLDVGDFRSDANRLIFAAIAYMMDEARIELDGLTLRIELERRGHLEMVGGSAYIAALTDAVPDIAHVERHAKALRKYRKRYDQVVTGAWLQRMGLDDTEDPDDTAIEAVERLTRHAGRSENQSRPFEDVLQEACDEQRSLRDRDRSSWLDCGFAPFNDYKLFYPTLVLISADKGIGKSALMTALARNLGASGHPNAMLSLESSGKEIGLRYMSMETAIPHRYMRDWRTFSDRNFDQVAECLRVTHGRGMHFAHGLESLESISNELRRLKHVRGIQAVFIDYIQLTRALGRFERGGEEMYAHIANRLLHLAIELQIVICAFSQVNKEGNVAYADSISKAARVWLHFDRPHKESVRTDPDFGMTCSQAGKQHNRGCETRSCFVPFIIRKNNEERTGQFNLHYDEITQRWSDGKCEAVNCMVAQVSRPQQGQLT